MTSKGQLEHLTVPELKLKAKKLGLHSYSKLRKPELVALILRNKSKSPKRASPRRSPKRNSPSRALGGRDDEEEELYKSPVKTKEQVAGVRTYYPPETYAPMTRRPYQQPQHASTFRTHYPKDIYG